MTDSYIPGSRAPVAGDTIGGETYQYVKLADPTADSADPIGTTANPLKVKDVGTFGYDAGTAAGNVNVPTGALIKRVSVVAGAAVGATVTVLGGDTITIPAGLQFDELIPGDAEATSATDDVVIGGTVQSYYVSWVV